MCCLQYEQNAYDDMLAKMPKRGDKVETPDGVGIVAETATLKGQIKVRFSDENGENTKFGTYVLGDFSPLGKNGKIRLEKPQEELIPEEEPVAIAEEVIPASTEEPKESTEQGEKKNKRKHPRHRRGRDHRKKPQGGGEAPKPTTNGGNGGYSNGYQE